MIGNMPVVVDVKLPGAPTNTSLSAYLGDRAREIEETGRFAVAVALREILRRRGGRSKWKWLTGHSGRNFYAENPAGSDDVEVLNDATSTTGFWYPEQVEEKYRRVENTVKSNLNYLGRVASDAMVKEWNDG